MITHEQLLKLLAKNSAQSPMTFADLLAISGLQPATLTMVLDQMHAAHSINQATVTRSGIAQREVWPTGMAKQLNAYADPSKRVAPTPLRPLPRRDEIKPKLTEATMSQNMTQDLEVAEQTPKALTILKFIEANPVCNSAQISHGTGIAAPRSYIKAHVMRGNVLVIGENRQNQYLQLAPGQTAEGIYGNGYTKHAAKPAAITEAALPAINLSAADDAQIPVFITKREDEVAADGVASPKFDSDLGFYADTAPKNMCIQFSQDDFAIDAINTLFDLLPPQSEIVIRRADGELQIDIEADVFGKPVARTVLINEVIETLSALHIVTVEMA